MTKTTKNYIPKQKLIRLRVVCSSSNIVNDGTVENVEPGASDVVDVGGM